jgi:hypothetical protein
LVQKYHLGKMSRRSIIENILSAEKRILAILSFRLLRSSSITWHHHNVRGKRTGSTVNK